MDTEGIKFLNRLYQDMHMSDVVMHTAEKSDDKEEKVEKYLERLERTHDGKHLDYLKNLYYDKYVIKEENITQKYLNFLDSQYFNTYGYHMTKDMEQEHIRTIIEEQKKSLDIWLEYLTSEDAKFYPMWAKYWAFQGMLKIGALNPTTGSYDRRTSSTTSPFVELDNEMLSKSIDLVKKSINKEEISDQELELLVTNGNFFKLYTTLINQKKEVVLNNKIIEGH